VLGIGDRIWLEGGAAPEPVWLGGGDGYEGTVRRFLAGPSAGWVVVELEESITVTHVTGRWLILGLRGLESRWGDRGSVHVILCAAEPREMVRGTGPGVELVENEARYRRL